MKLAAQLVKDCSTSQAQAQRTSRLTVQDSLAASAAYQRANHGTRMSPVARASARKEFPCAVKAASGTVMGVAQPLPKKRKFGKAERIARLAATAVQWRTPANRSRLEMPR